MNDQGLTVVDSCSSDCVDILVVALTKNLLSVSFTNAKRLGNNWKMRSKRELTAKTVPPLPPWSIAAGETKPPVLLLSPCYNIFVRGYFNKFVDRLR
jgi:hypothetical protein